MPRIESLERTSVSIHLPVDGSIYSSAADQVLMDSVFPAADRLLAEDSSASYFFVRYLDPSGPHIRFRIRSAANSPIDTTSVLGLLNQYGGARTSHRPILAVPYEAETERYGGFECMDAAEQFFALSSYFVRCQLVNIASSSRGARRSCALVAMLRFALSCTRDIGEAARLLDHYVASLGGHGSETFAAGGPVEQATRRRVGDLAIAQIKIADADSSAPAFLCVREFGAASHQYARDLEAKVAIRNASANRELIPKLQRSILCSQLHMTSNRFGITRQEESFLGSIGSLALADTGSTGLARSRAVI